MMTERTFKKIYLFEMELENLHMCFIVISLFCIIQQTKCKIEALCKQKFYIPLNLLLIVLKISTYEE